MVWICSCWRVRVHSATPLAVPDLSCRASSWPCPTRFPKLVSTPPPPPLRPPHPPIPSLPHGRPPMLPLLLIAGSWHHSYSGAISTLINCYVRCHGLQGWMLVYVHTSNLVVFVSKLPSKVAISTSALLCMPSSPFSSTCPDVRFHPAAYS